jgi:hypothetical protein
VDPPPTVTGLEAAVAPLGQKPGAFCQRGPFRAPLLIARGAQQMPPAETRARSWCLPTRRLSRATRCLRARLRVVSCRSCLAALGEF